MFKVVVTDYEYDDVAQERRIITGFGAEFADRHLKTEDEIVEAVKDADAVIVQYARITPRVIAAMTRCKMVIKYGIGVDNIDQAAATAKGIYVCNVPDYGIDEVSNHAIAMMLALAKKLPVLSRVMKDGDWHYRDTVPLFRIAGSTLGLVGLGRIPALVARKMAGFDVRIVAYDPFVKPEVARQLGVERVSFDKLIAESDLVSIHCPLTPDTRHLFNTGVFARMKPSAILVNTARGPIVEEAALIEALRLGKIAGAGLDVFEAEPLAADCPLRRMENAIVTPHCAWYSKQAIETLQRKVAEEVVNVLKGNKPFNCVNRAALEAQSV